MLRTGFGFLTSLTLISCLLFSPCYAQTDESAAPWRIEDAGEVEYLPSGSIDLNRITLGELLQVLGMTYDLARAVIELREALGSFSSLDELRRLEDVSPETIEQISPYFRVTLEGRKYTINATTRYQFDSPIKEGVEESPYRQGEKLFFSGESGISLGLAFEKDAGEGELWDHSAFSLELPLPEAKGFMVLGDYLAGFGQGLVIRARRNFGLSGRSSDHMIFYPRRLRPYHSWDESIALRGAGANLNLNPVNVFTWGSQRYRDAYLNESGQITSFDDSGLHRSATEEARRDACLEEAWGAHVEYGKLGRNLSIGATLSSVKWDRQYVNDDESISETRAGSFNLGYDAEKANVIMEAAWDDRGAGAQMGSMQLISRLLKTSVSIYYVDPDYFAPLASSLDFDLGKVNNREGVYASLRIKIPHGSLSGFAHLYRFPRRQPGQSWGGQDLYVRNELRLARGLSSTLTSRWVQEEEGGTIEKTSRWRGSESINWMPSSDFRLKSKVDLCTSHLTNAVGWMLRLSADGARSVSPGFHIDSGFGTALYYADDYAVRLYWFEYDESRSMRARPLWGKGGILEVSVGLRYQSWGRLRIRLFWDQPMADSNRSPSRTITLLYLYR